jgi:uncharacterized hydrophobic protein (TIGR00271 family)
MLATLRKFLLMEGGLQLTTDEKSVCLKQIEDMSHPVRSYFVLTILSAAIAGFGLLQGSTAVVIGAMLVAPLMGPIFGIALALIRDDQKLLFDSLVAEILGIALVIGLGWVVGSMAPLIELSSEVVSRTNPSIYDILIALASGLAGAYALVNPKLSTSLPGVAIATALVPPLGACGICLAAQEWKMAFGAFILFAVNILAIELAAAGVFALYKLGTRRSWQGWTSVWKQFGWSAVLLLLMSFWFYRSFTIGLQEAEIRNKVRTELTEMAHDVQGSALDDSTVEFLENGNVRVMAAYLTPKTFEPSMVRMMDEHLDAVVGRNVDLTVRSLVSSDNNAEGPVFVPQADLDRRQQQSERSQIYSNVYQSLSDGLHGFSGASLVRLDLPNTAQGSEALAEVSTPTALSPGDVEALEKRIRDETGRSYKLSVRSILTIVANKSEFLYRPAEPQVSDEQQRLQTRLEQALKNQLSTRIPGATLSALNLSQTNGEWRVVASVRTPEVVSPELVGEIEALIHEHVDPSVRLVIRSSVEADASAAGFVGAGSD